MHHLAEAAHNAANRLNMHQLQVGSDTPHLHHFYPVFGLGVEKLVPKT